MTPRPDMQEFVDAQTYGKHVGDSWYAHVDALSADTHQLLQAVSSLAGCPRDGYNVLKITPRQHRVSLLNYPKFFEEAFPSLADAWTINLQTGRVAHRSYAADANPPILHRKETLLATQDPRRARFAALTAEAEAAGLFHDSRIIGHRLQWEEELKARGVCVVDHAIRPVDPSQGAIEMSAEVLRYKTALVRNRLSTPAQALHRAGFLDGGLSFFDYGCGRGDDMAIVSAHGIEVAGWDPHFQPASDLVVSDVVNLGFVLNVIENVVERREALLGAWKCARKVLSVAALIGGRTAYEKHRLYRDGVLTSVGTFQKYYTHAELGEYIGSIVGREPVSVEPGIYFVFRDDESEQDYLVRRQSSRFRPTLARPPREPSGTTIERSRAYKGRPTRNRWVIHADFAERFWNRCLELARIPTAEEFPEYEKLRACLGQPKVVLKHLIEERGTDVFEAARSARRDDLLVFLSLNLFEKRRSFGSLSVPLRNDVKEHLSSYANGIEQAKLLLFSVGEAPRMLQAARDAAGLSLGWLEGDEAFYIDSRLVNELPIVLRVYIGCAGKLYGQAEAADVVKIHLQSRKVTFLLCDDYEGRLVPDLVERIKVDLGRQKVSIYSYGTNEFPSQPLYFKSRFMNPSLPLFEKQLKHDKWLLAKSGLDLAGFGPSRSEYESAVKKVRPNRIGANAE